MNQIPLTTQHAYTLIEMMLVLAITTVLLSMTITFGSQLYAKNKSEIVKNELLAALNFAEQQAWLKQATIKLCKSADQQTCDKNANNSLLVIKQANQQIIKLFFLNAEGVLYWRSYPFYRDYLLFKMNELLRVDNATFWYCSPKSSQPMWAVAINKAGRIRTLLPNASGEIEDQNGKILIC